MLPNLEHMNAAGHVACTRELGSRPAPTVAGSRSIWAYPLSLFALAVISNYKPTVGLWIVQTALEVIDDVALLLLHDVHSDMPPGLLIRRIEPVLYGYAPTTVRQRI